ncbi:hypothetical protein AYJ54_07910 [Bradyrhizobium centrolobii]|uniref:Uncharacterized protein n=1 Tax=Bradyrhizobium centrolobii TaxID=1505087 RepID=A0A176YYB8_9BRAD|nr:hypothetical protein [Bradyrhizobium centrolobii]OAF11776.1 hypothetical protein AYJ54_07910 [Bradyrhizobium centrolobii]
MMGLSAAGGAMMRMGGFGLGGSLAQQVQSETDEERRRRERELAAQRAGMSPAGRALAYGGAMLSF